MTSTLRHKRLIKFFDNEKDYAKQQRERNHANFWSGRNKLRRQNAPKNVEIWRIVCAFIFLHMVMHSSKGPNHKWRHPLVLPFLEGRMSKGKHEQSFRESLYCERRPQPYILVWLCHNLLQLQLIKWRYLFSQFGFQNHWAHHIFAVRILRRWRQRRTLEIFRSAKINSKARASSHLQRLLMC